MENPNVIEVANLYPSIKGYNRMKGVICDIEGVSQTVRANSGGHNEVKIAEPQALRMVRTDDGKKIRKAYEAHEITHGFNEFRKAEPREDGICNTISTVQKDNYIAIPQATKHTVTAESNGLCCIEPCIAAMRGRNPDNPSDRTAGIPTEQRLEIGGNVSNTLTTVQKDNLVVEQKVRIRKLTPRECWRLMDFDDDVFDRASEVNSPSQLYKQAGNTIVVNVLVAIFGQMFDGKENVYKELGDK